MEIIPSLFEYCLSDTIDSSETVSKPEAEAITLFFSENPLFNWSRTHNGCEARADAVCVLLQEWVFSGKYFKTMWED